MSTRQDQASRDPILDKLVSDSEPPAETVLEEARAEGSATGTPPIGETALEGISAMHHWNFLQVLGQGLITGASDNDPSVIGTYSRVGS